MHRSILGLDVLTRITYEMEHPQRRGVQALKEAIVASINEMIADVCGQTGVKKEQIYEVSVGANCTMMHMLLGVDARSIGHAPYRPEFTKAQKLKAAGIGLWAGEETMLYCLPSVSAYIGADIVAGVRVCGLHEETERCFLSISARTERLSLQAEDICSAVPARRGLRWKE